MTILPPRRTDPLDTEQFMLWASRNPQSRSRYKFRRFPIALMDIAAKMAVEKSLEEAAAATGVGKWSIKKHLARLRKQGKLGYKPCTKPGKKLGNPNLNIRKYSEATIKAVLRAGIREHEATGLPLRQCVARAEKAYGVSVHYAWRRWISGLEEL
jgi:transposase